MNDTTNAKGMTMNEKTKQVPVVSWSVAGNWHMGPAAPNGCIAGQEERCVTTHFVFSADYYGKGPKLYVYSVTRIFFRHGNSSIINTSQDGNEKRIAKLMQEAGI